MPTPKTIINHLCPGLVGRIRELIKDYGDPEKETFELFLNIKETPTIARWDEVYRLKVGGYSFEFCESLPVMLVFDGWIIFRLV